MTGGWVSLTVTVNVHCAKLILENPHVTVLAPTGKNDPDGGLQNGSPGSDPPHEPDIVGFPNVTTAPHSFESLLTVLFAGQTIVQLPVVTVTVNWQLPPLEQVTVVVPTGKLEPDGGVHVTGEPEHAAGS